jgi:hypothetical protein
MRARFVIDERSIDLNGFVATTGLEVIEALLDLVDDARQDGHGVCFDEDLFAEQRSPQRSFWELCDPESPIFMNPEVMERAAAAFGAMPRWREIAAPEPPDFDVVVDGGVAETTASVAWAHQQAIVGGLDSVACLCASGNRRTGLVDVELLKRIEGVWFIKTPREMEEYFRWLISSYASKPDDLEDFAKFAFKKIDFVERCFDGIRNMSKNCRQMAPAIVRHLSVITDEGQRIFQGPWNQVPAEFGAFGVDISDENGNTKGNHIARGERLRIVDGEKLYFWWHTKIERHQDRIHIYPNKVSEQGKIIVGIFSLHLTV